MAVSVQSYEIMKGNGDSSSSVAWSISAGKWVAGVSIFFVSMIVICYSACLYQGHCGTGPWNSISHSWEHPPGSYASRFVVGTSCDMIAVFHGFLYIANVFASRQPNTSKKCCQCYTNEVLLGIGLFSAFCLSWVGAICDADTDPECLGNNTIHSTCAVLFFLLTDVIAGVLACDPKTEEAKKPKNRIFLMFIFIVMSSCTFVRLCKWHCDIFGGPLPNNGDNFVIIAEVIEVSFFIVFMNTLAQTYFTGINWSVVLNSNPPEGEDLIIAVKAKRIVYLGCLLILFVLSSTYIIGEAEDEYGDDTKLPLIGDMWTFKPNNWISRWSTVQATSAFIWVAVFSQIALSNNSWNNYDTFLLLLQVFSLLSFAGSGIINKSDGENKKWHDILTALFYFSADLFVLFTIFIDQTRYSNKMKFNKSNEIEKPLKSLQVFGFLMILSNIRYVLSSSSGGSTLYDVLEWLNMIIIVSFFAVNCVYRVATGDMALAFIVTPSSSSGYEDDQTRNNIDNETSSTVPSYDKVAAVPSSEHGISLL
jgi:hypothetical protein